MEAVDVLVVGLGPAGGAAAATAAAHGLRVLAIDRKRAIGSPVQCAEYIPAPLRRYALNAGIAVQPIASMATFLPSACRASSAFGGWMIERAAFDRALAGAAARAGADVLTQARLRELDARASIAGIESGNGMRVVRYATLIAADGPHSTVARCLGLAMLALMATRQYTVPLRAPDAETEVYLSARYPGGYAWLFPKGASANLGVGYDRRLGGDMKISLDALHADLVATGKVGQTILARTGGPIPIGGLRSRLAVDNVAFAGDAGGFTHPISGAGIAAAVDSGERAAHAAGRWLAGEQHAAFAEYEEEMRDLYQGTLERALERRREMASGWGTPAAAEDGFHRRGWIAFSDYYA